MNESERLVYSGGHTVPPGPKKLMIVGTALFALGAILAVFCKGPEKQR